MELTIRRALLSLPLSLSLYLSLIPVSSRVSRGEKGAEQSSQEKKGPALHRQQLLSTADLVFFLSIFFFD